MFGFISKKQAEEEKLAFGKEEYFRGAKDAAAQLKQKEDAAETQKNLMLEGWATLKRAQQELENERARVILEGMKEVYGNKSK
jgi:hypothetical protein